MPTYEYRCPEGHTFELFQRMSDPPPKCCEVCGKSPVQRVLFAPAVVFKGSGFYSTDYGRGKKREGSKDGDSASSDSTPKKEEKASKGDSASPAKAAD